jgi:hypothetical protein
MLMMMLRLLLNGTSSQSCRKSAEQHHMCGGEPKSQQMSASALEQRLKPVLQPRQQQHSGSSNMGNMCGREPTEHLHGCWHVVDTSQKRHNAQLPQLVPKTLRCIPPAC